MFKLALDAGHGLHTSGKRCLKSLDPNETREWWLNDRIADRVEALLEGYEGVTVLRMDDITGACDVPLAQRTKAANVRDADIYLSIHHNAGIKGGTGGGIVAYCHPKAGQESVELRDAFYEALVVRTGLVGNRANPKTMANHYVTRETTMPAVLLELGFMDSATDVPVILSEDYSVSCAEAIVEVLVARWGLVLKTAEVKDAPDKWAREAWAWATENGVLDGTRPRDPLTRQELAQVLFEMKGQL